MSLLKAIKRGCAVALPNPPLPWLIVLSLLVPSLADASRMYWAEENTVYVADADGNNVSIFAIGVWPTSVAFDSVNQRVFWTDNGTDTISCARYDGTDRRVLYTTGPSANPRGLALALDTGRMYWAEENAVYAANVDGSNVSVFFTGTYPLAVAVDSAEQKAYWTDNGTDTISRANYDGTGVEILYSSDAEGNPDGLALALETPAQAVYELISTVESLNLPREIERSLKSSLEGAVESLAKGNDEAAIGKLEAFVNKVEAQRGKKIEEANADSMVVAAEEIIASI